MKKNILINLCVVVVTFLLCFLAVELEIRYASAYDEDGDLASHGLPLLPYRLPVNTIQQTINEYIRLSPATKVMYDPYLGWTPRPNAVSRDGLYKYNSAGLRSAPTEYSLLPQPGVLRIAIFGDSYTHGDEVPFEQTWGYLLENKLNQQGIQAEVLNFGVGGYGMDQAFLRWQRQGAAYAPHIVIFGLQLENLSRNINLLRPIYRHKTDIPFSKPRFIINNQDQLQLINSPTIPLEQIVPVVENFSDWEWSKYEYYYQAECYQDRPWLYSRFISLMIQAASRCGKQPLSYDLADEPAQLTVKIVDAFRQDVEAHGAKFLVVHMPRRLDLARISQNTQSIYYSGLLPAVEKNNSVIYPEYTPRLQRIPDESYLNALFVGDHYSLLGNDFVSDAIVNYMLEHKLAVQP